MVRLFLGLIFYSIFSLSINASSTLCDKMACRSYKGLLECKERKGYVSWTQLFKRHKKCKESFAYVCPHNVPRSKGEPYAGCRNGPESLKACAYATNYSPKQLLRNSKTCKAYYERYLKIQADKAKVEAEIDELFDEVREDNPQALSSAQEAIETVVKEDSSLPRASLKKSPPPSPPSANPQRASLSPPAQYPMSTMPAPLVPAYYSPGYNVYPVPSAYPAPYPYPRQPTKRRQRPHSQQAQTNPLFEKIGMDTIKTIGSAILAA